MGNKLKELREKRGLSQAEVAKIIGISRQMYNKYERGDTEPSLGAIKTLCTLYAVPYEELLDYADTGRKNTSDAYEFDEISDKMSVSSPSAAYEVTIPSPVFGTENYLAQITNLLPHLLLSEKSRLLTMVSQSITDEVERGKIQPLKVNQDAVTFPTEEEFTQGMERLLAFTESIGFMTHGVTWTREDMHER